MSDTFKYENSLGSTGPIKDAVYAAFIEEKTADKAKAEFYGVKKWYHTNTAAFEKNIATLIDDNLISKREEDGKILYKSSIDPIYCKIDERLRSSRESYEKEEYMAMKLIVDSDWFRKFFSYKMVYMASPFECIRYYATLYKRGLNLNDDFERRQPSKIQINEPVYMARCLMNTIGIVCFYLQGYLVNNNYCTDISAEDIVSAGSFDTVISKSFKKNSPVNVILCDYQKYCKKYCVEDTVPSISSTGSKPSTSQVPIIPESLLEWMVKAAPFLPQKICNIFMKMEVRNQLTLLNVYLPAAKEVTEEFEKNKKNC